MTNRPRAVVLHEHDDAEVLKVEPIEVGAPGPGQLRLHQTYLGVNFHDIYVRSGLYRTLSLPGSAAIPSLARSPRWHRVRTWSISARPPGRSIRLPCPGWRPVRRARRVVFHYAAQRGRLEQMFAALCSALEKGWLSVEPPHEFALEDAASAHRLLESGKAVQPILLKT